MLHLINADRKKAGLVPVKLGTNPAAQQHADDMLANFYLGHIDSGGMKPYMCYTLAGGLGSNGENAGYAGTQDPNDRANYALLDPKAHLASLEFGMMYDDASSDWGHRDNILRPEHQYVNIGIAYNRTRLALSQQFEEMYLNFSQAPRLQDGTLTLAGTLDPSVGSLYSIDVYYDPPPTAYNHAQLLS
ncbi:MAG: CAP domain-containing protein [Dehalococcoidia bacterium]|nr:CAP domain-containing protein [Dehalococcoidia bacterium]